MVDYFNILILTKGTALLKPCYYLGYRKNC